MDSNEAFIQYAVVDKTIAYSHLSQLEGDTRVSQEKFGVFMRDHTKIFRKL